MKTAKHNTQLNRSLKPTSLVTNPSAEAAINSRRQPARLAFLVALLLVTFIAVASPASAADDKTITVAKLAGPWQATLIIDGGCGLGTKLVTFTLKSTGVASDAVGTYHTPSCGDDSETGSFTVTALNSFGTGTAQLDFGGTVFNFSIQVAKNGQAFNMVDITDSGNYEEGTAVKQ
jgi:hypothetical protein